MRENDFELISLIREGNDDALNTLYEKYKPIIVKKSEDAIRKIPHHGVEISDIMQEGFIALDEAINGFNDLDKESSFYTFANLCIDRKIVNFLRKSFGNREKILNDAINIDDNLEKCLKDGFDVEMSIIDEANNNDIYDRLNKSLTNFERKVFNLKCEMYTCMEIANILNKDSKSIYNTLQRIKIKIKKIINEDNNSNN